MSNHRSCSIGDVKRTGARLAKDIRALGIKAGDVIFLHSSLSSQMACKIETGSCVFPLKTYSFYQ